MFITLEGIDGSGKTTLWDTLHDRLPPQLDSEVVFTREPTETWYGDAVLHSVQDDDADSIAELFLYTADHAAHLAETVRPALQRDAVVVSDRGIDSRIAYQATQLEAHPAFPDDTNAIEYIRDVHAPWTRWPDQTVFIDVPPEVGAERSGKTNKFEQVEQLKAVATAYERVRTGDPVTCGPADRFVEVSGTQAPDAVADRVVDLLTEWCD